MKLALIQFVKDFILFSEAKREPLSYQPDIIPGRTVVKHLGDDWIAVKEGPNRDGYIWVNVGIIGGKPTKNAPVLLQYGDAIYREKRVFYPDPLPIPKLAEDQLGSAEPGKPDKLTSQVLSIPTGVVDAKTAWEYVEAHGYQIESNLEYFLAQNDKIAYMYAYKVLRVKRPQSPRFYKAEPLLAKSENWAYFYATNILHSRWPEAEPTIAKFDQLRNMYCNEFNLTFDPKTKTFR